jgi:hypothetical protein
MLRVDADRAEAVALHPAALVGAEVAVAELGEAERLRLRGWLSLFLDPSIVLDERDDIHAGRDFEQLCSIRIRVFSTPPARVSASRGCRRS